MSQIPIGWLMKKEGFETTPLTKQVNYHRPLYLFLPKGHHWLVMGEIAKLVMVTMANTCD